MDDFNEYFQILRCKEISKVIMIDTNNEFFDRIN